MIDRKKAMAIQPSFPSPLWLLRRMLMTVMMKTMSPMTPSDPVMGSMPQPYRIIQLPLLRPDSTGLVHFCECKTSRPAEMHQP